MFGVGIFRYVFLIEGFDFVVKGFFDCKMVLVVFVGLVIVVYWVNVDEVDFGGVSGSS